MKLLFDENLSPSLVQRLADLFPDSAHVHNLGLGQADDATISAYAHDHDYVVVTKDADFRALRLTFRETCPERGLDQIGKRLDERD